MGRACWCACGHHVVDRWRIVTNFALAVGTVGWGWSVAFPWLEVFDFVQGSGGLDPLDALRNSDNPHITHAGQFSEKGFGSCCERKIAGQVSSEPIWPIAYKSK